MAEENIPIEEVNRLRISLGLKPIPGESSVTQEYNIQKGSSSQVSTSNVKQNNSSIQPRSDVVGAHDEPKRKGVENGASANDRVLDLRRKLNDAKVEMKRNVLLKDTEDGADWLASVGNHSKSKFSNASSIPSECHDKSQEHENPAHTVKISHSLSSMSSGKDTILTLKEATLNDEGGDMLIDEGVAHDAQQAKNIKLKQLNQDRKRKKININAQSDDDNEEDNNSYFVLGDGKIIQNKSRKEIEDHDKANRHQGKIKISMESTSESDELVTDYVPVKLKKRKVKGVKGLKDRRVRQSPDITRVNLVDEDDPEEEDNDLESFLNLNRFKKQRHETQRKTAEEIALDIQREKLDKEQRASDIAKSNGGGGIIVDENSSFLENLKSELISRPAKNITFEKIDLKTTSADRNTVSPMYSSDEEEEATNDKTNIKTNGPDFHDGLASTLNFLQERNVLPSSQKPNNKMTTPKEDELLKIKQNVEARKIEEETAREMKQSNMRYSKEELDRIKQYKEREISKRTAAIQQQRLVGYNPEVKLAYKDDKGNQLTTKEAYKKLSQAFHGTKSNKKKQIKAQRKVDGRKSQVERDSYLGV